MRVLRSIYDFITGGSIASPMVVILGIVAASLAPQGARGPIVATVAIIALIAATLEPSR